MFSALALFRRALVRRPATHTPFICSARSMASTHPRSRSGSPAQPPEKRLRLDAGDAIEVDSPVVDQQPPEDAPADKPHPPSSSKKQPKKHKNKKNARRAPEPYSHDDILSREVTALLGQDIADAAKAADLDWSSPFEFSQQLELTVSCISPSTGLLLSGFRCRHIPCT